MVPATKILETAVQEKVDVIGLSGLITPSLDEMVTVAEEMTRAEMTMPLLIGGATTSRVHTALRIAPAYTGPVVHVLDASRAVGVASTLVSDTQCEPYLTKIAEEYDAIRKSREGKGQNPLLPLAEARARGFVADMALKAPAPKQPGIHVFDDWDLAKLREFIDWTPFFQAWELAGHYPAILTDAVVGTQASELFADAQAMLDKIVNEKWLTARAVIGFWPAANLMDDVEIYTDDTRTQPLATLHHLRQQADKPVERPNLCLADFIAPKSFGKPDWIGGFAVTAGLGIEPHLERFHADHDDYSAIILKALADRLAEAFAERMHLRVRKEFWGFVPDESLDNEALIAEKYQGIRPAPGYPACPDHTEKATLFKLLDATNNAGIILTEGFSMYPAAAVSGWYFSHPGSQYFVVGRLGLEQVQDYAKRKGWSQAEAERWLAANLDYDPD
jgi:5-methyltetrahydrofolate--homocysteine methyltransferase